ncbi:ribokinase isoform X1 [Drosophila albomicans]|uniref:Ribokinase n=2 Tax=Drosophila albomicans TaxID=7291 RepID=A0A9C6W3X5_DROAB|nr:ribokinase isoform X1 [Drosophila albomicans]
MQSVLKLTKIRYHNTVVSFRSWWLRFKSSALHQMSRTRKGAHPQPQTTEQPPPPPKDNGPIEVLVFGSINMDYITYLNELPKPGETLQAMYREQCFGGKGANQCMAAAKLGANCALIAKLGQDDLGSIYYEYLQQMGINTDYVEQLEGVETGIAQINVDDNAENTIVVLPGANQRLNSKDVSAAKKLFKTAKVLLCQLETNHKAVLCALKLFKGVSILNAAPAMKDMPPELIQAASILCVNEVEAAQLTDREDIKTLQDAKAAAGELLEKGAQSVIITMGALGAVHLSQSDPKYCIHCPAAPVRYLADTSGAGDAFLGSLAYHILRFPNLNPESHIYAANICAAYSVGHRGTQPSFPGSEIAQDDLCHIYPNFCVIPEETEEEATLRKKQETEAAKAKETETAAKPEAAPAPVAAATPEPEPTPAPVAVAEEPPTAAAPVPAPALVPTPNPILAASPEQAPMRGSIATPRTSSNQTAQPKRVSLDTREVAATMPAARVAQRATEVAAAMVSSQATQRTKEVTAHVVPGRIMHKPRKVQVQKRPIPNRK